MSLQVVRTNPVLVLSGTKGDENGEEGDVPGVEGHS